MRTQFLGVGFLGKSPNVTAQTRKNMYLDVQQQGDKVQVSAHPTPGLELLTTFGNTPARAMHEGIDLLYVVHRGTFWEVNNAGTKTNRGTLETTSGRCSISSNGLEIMIVDGQYGYIYTIATTTLAKITDGDFSAAPQTVTFNNGYFIVSENNTGVFWVSALYNGAAWDALDFATAESHPDYLLRVEEDNGDIVLFGEKTTEFWASSGQLDFPYARLAGTEMQWGLAARWSVTKFDNSLMFLGKSRQGEVKVMFLNGYEPITMSNSDLEKIFNSGVTSNATALSYLIDGHSMYQISFPDLLRTFLFDGNTKAWSELTSSNSRHRGEISSYLVTDKIVSDYENGDIFRLKSGVYTDNGSPIVREITGRHHEKSLDYFTVKQFTLDCEMGVGLASGQGSNPQVMMQYSIDNGHTWSEELWTDLGKIGEYEGRAEWWRLGRGRDFVFRVRVSDPVKVVITGAGLKV